MTTFALHVIVLVKYSKHVPAADTNHKTVVCYNLQCLLHTVPGMIHCIGAHFVRLV